MGIIVKGACVVSHTQERNDRKSRYMTTLIKSNPKSKKRKVKYQELEDGEGD